jgi:hypothetical protein
MLVAIFIFPGGALAPSLRCPEFLQNSLPVPTMLETLRHTD